MEDEPAPAVDRLTLFQIENGRVRVLRTQRRKPCSFSAVKKLHAEYIPIELHGGFHVRDPKSHRRNLLHHDAMMPAVYRRRAPDFRALNLRLSSAKLQIF